MAPILEEFAFRGLWQPLLTRIFLHRAPALATPSLLGIPLANLVSVAVTGIGFGVIHYPNYKQNAAYAVLLAVVDGMVNGVLKELGGLRVAIVAHITHNLWDRSVWYFSK